MWDTALRTSRSESGGELAGVRTKSACRPRPEKQMRRSGPRMGTLSRGEKLGHPTRREVPALRPRGSRRDRPNVTSATPTPALETVSDVGRRAFGAAAPPGFGQRDVLAIL